MGRRILRLAGAAAFAGGVLYAVRCEANDLEDWVRAHLDAALDALEELGELTERIDDLEYMAAGPVESSSPAWKRARARVVAREHTTERTAP
jgi:hypothetical protein